MPVGNPGGKEYLQCNLQSWKLPSKDTPSQGIPTRISLPTLRLRISIQKSANEKYDNCFLKTHRKEVMSKLFRNIK